MVNRIASAAWPPCGVSRTGVTTGRDVCLHKVQRSKEVADKSRLRDDMSLSISGWIIKLQRIGTLGWTWSWGPGGFASATCGQLSVSLVCETFGRVGAVEQKNKRLPNIGRAHVGEIGA